MTNEEARNILLTSVHPQTAEEAEAIGIAVRAVERMIPKKPTKKADEWDDGIKGIGLYCPECSEEIGRIYIRRYKSENTCGNCGQKIDWSE